MRERPASGSGGATLGSVRQVGETREQVVGIRGRSLLVMATLVVRAENRFFENDHPGRLVGDKSPPMTEIKIVQGTTLFCP
jgi:hypothetical protein